MLETLTEVLRQHQWDIDLRGCTCRDQGTKIGDDAAMADHQAAAVAAAGLAVVELPKPEVDEDGQLWFGEYDIRVDNTGTFTDYGDIFTDFGLGHEVLQQISPPGARHWAAAFLAAAVAAEAGE